MLCLCIRMNSSLLRFYKDLTWLGVRPKFKNHCPSTAVGTLQTSARVPVLLVWVGRNLWRPQCQWKGCAASRLTVWAKRPYWGVRISIGLIAVIQYLHTCTIKGPLLQQRSQETESRTIFILSKEFIFTICSKYLLLQHKSLKLSSINNNHFILLTHFVGQEFGQRTVQMDCV